jgi:hypothetical protein
MIITIKSTFQLPLSNLICREITIEIIVFIERESFNTGMTLKQNGLT